MNLKKKHKIPLTFFQKNVFYMLKGTAFAQIIGLIGGLYIANIYGPDSYGVYGVFISITGIFAILNTLQLEYSIVLTSNSSDRKQIVSFLLAISFLITLISLSIIYFLTPNSTSFIDKENLLLGVVAAFLFSLIAVFEYSLISKNDFKKISISKVLITSFTLFFHFIFFYLSHQKGLIYGFLIAPFLVVLFFFKMNITDITKIEFKKVKEIIKKNKTLIKYALPSNLINAIANNMMPILILLFFSISESASYFLSIKMLSAPLLLISNAVSKPYFQKATALYKNKDATLLKFTKKIAISNVLIMLCFIVLLTVFINYFLILFFDNQWTSLAHFSLGLSFLFLARSLFSPISYIVEIMDKNHIGLFFNSYLIIVNLVAIYIGVLLNDSIKGVFFMSIINGLGYFFMYFYFIKLIKSNNS